jgi:long-subunit acyl-CoA synthetase (AMP-forming)
MRGYFKDPERTAEVLREDWYSTGDIGTIDAEGNITLTGRAKDLIVLPSGLNVWPSDIEDALRNDPAVRDAAVIAVPTKAGGATLHAYLIPQSVKDRGVNATANSRAREQRARAASAGGNSVVVAGIRFSTNQHAEGSPSHAGAA